MINEDLKKHRERIQGKKQLSDAEMVPINQLENYTIIIEEVEKNKIRSFFREGLTEENIDQIILHLN